MRNLLKLSLLLLALSCSSTFDFDDWAITYPPEIDQQIQLFKAYAPEGIKYKRVDIIFCTDMTNNKGVQIAGKSRRLRHLIMLDSTTDLYKYSRTMLVLHELGHYVLKRNHENMHLDLYGFHNVPASFMNTAEAKPTDAMLKSKPDLLDYYMNELFFK